MQVIGGLPSLKTQLPITFLFILDLLFYPLCVVYVPLPNLVIVFIWCIIYDLSELETGENKL